MGDKNKDDLSTSSGDLEKNISSLYSIELPSKPKKGRWLIAILSTFIVLLLAAIIVYIVLYLVAKEVENVYAVMIDAGSTSSKFSLYYWSDWPFRTTGWVQESNYSTLKPGVSSYGPDPPAGASLVVSRTKEMVNYGVPIATRKATHLYLGATAGMRLLEYTAPTDAVAVMQALRTALSGSGYDLNDPQKDVRIISGSDEGLYGWISVNYLLRNFGNEDGRPPKSSYDQMGAIDWGGASTQIAFVPEEGVTDQHVVKQSVFGTTYDVYSYSFLCYGKEASMKRYYAQLIVNGDAGAATINSPCHMAGYTTKVNSADIFAKPCVLGRDNIIGPELTKPDNTPAEITVQGTGNPGQCETLIKAYFRKRPCTHGTCSFNDVSQPKPRGNYYGISGLFFVMNFLRPSKTKIITTRTDLHKAAFDLCSTTWTSIVNKYPASEQKFISDYCYAGIFAENLLDGYGFVTDDQWKTVEFVQEVNGDTATWAMGYVLSASGKIASLEPKIALGTVPFGIGLALFLLALVISVGTCVFIMLRN